jgi:hypothetical protein
MAASYAAFASESIRAASQPLEFEAAMETTGTPPALLRPIAVVRTVR